MVSKKIADHLTIHVNNEIYSAYLYLAMSSYAASIGLNGIANWFNIQVQEELLHAQKVYNYMLQQGGRVFMKAIKEPPQDFNSAADLYEKTLTHEQTVTAFINDFSKEARTVNDNATEIFLQWFVSEQIEEEASATEVLQKLKLVGKDGNGLLLIDNELGQRVFTPPAQTQ